MSFIGTVKEIALNQHLGLSGSLRSKNDNLRFTECSNISFFDFLSRSSGSKKYNKKLSNNLLGFMVTEKWPMSAVDPLATFASGLAYDSRKKRIWLTDINTRKIYQTDIHGQLISSFSSANYDPLATMPLGIAINTAGNLWISDGVTRKIYNISATGVLISNFLITTFDASNPLIWGLAVKKDGNLLACGYSNNTIYTITTTGVLVSSLKTNIYNQSDIGKIINNVSLQPFVDTVIFKMPFLESGNIDLLIWNQENTNAKVSVAILKDGEILGNKDYILFDTLINKGAPFTINNISLAEGESIVIRANRSGIVARITNGVKVNNPVAITEADDGSYYITDPVANNIYQIQPNGSLIMKIPMRFYDINALWPSGIAIDEKGNIYILDPKTSMVYKIDPHGLSQIIGGHDYFPATGVQRMIVLTKGGVLLRDDGDGSFPVLLNVLSQDGRFHAVEGGKEFATRNKKLFIFNGLDPVQVIDGDARVSRAVISPPLDWSNNNQPTFGLIHKNRLCGFGNINHPHRIYLSSIIDHEDFNAVDSWNAAIFSGEGDALIAGVSFKGLLILFKRPLGIYVVDTRQPLTSDWGISRLSRGVGLAGPHAFTLIDNDILFMDTHGNFQLLSSVQEFGDLNVKNISLHADMSKWVQQNINMTLLWKTQAIWYSHKREAHFTCAKKGSNIMNMRIIVDLNNEIPRFCINDVNINEAIWLRNDIHNIPRPVVSDDKGFVWQLEQPYLAREDEAYRSSFETQELDMLLPAKKNLAFVKLEYGQRGKWPITITTIRDSKLMNSYAMNMDGTEPTLGAFTLGTNKLAKQQLFRRRIRIGGQAERLAFKIENSGKGQDFCITNMWLYYKDQDDRA